MDANKARLRENGKPIWNNGNQTRPNHAGVNGVSQDGEASVVEIGSGDYAFELEVLGE